MEGRKSKGFVARAPGLGPPPGQRGIPDYPEPGLFIESLGHAPNDWEIYHSCWLVSDPMKTVNGRIDPEGVVFTRCETQLRDGTEGPARLLCDVIPPFSMSRSEERSQLRAKLHRRCNSKHHTPLGGANLAFRKDVRAWLRFSECAIWSLSHMRPNVQRTRAKMQGCGESDAVMLPTIDRIATRSPRPRSKARRAFS